MSGGASIVPWCAVWLCWVVYAVISMRISPPKVCVADVCFHRRFGSIVGGGASKNGVLPRP